MAAPVFNVKIPDGRNLNLCTRRGALDYVAWSPQFVERGLEHIHTLSDEQAGFNLMMLGIVSDSLAPEQITERIGKDQKKALAAYAATTFAAAAGDARWRRGAPLRAWCELWQAMVTWCKCPVFVKIFLKKDGAAAALDALAAAVASPSREFAENVLEITQNCCLTLKLKDLGLSGLGHGLAAAAIRCAPCAPDAIVLAVLRDLREDGRLVRKYFQAGSTCDAACRGAERRASPRIREDISKLRILAAAAAPREGAPTVNQLCRNCNKNESDIDGKMKQCANCGNAWYCSRECQKIDWKKHKLVCTKAPEYRGNDTKLTNNVVMRHVESSYFEIRGKIQRLLAGDPSVSSLADVVVCFDQENLAAGTSVTPYSSYADRSAFTEPDGIGHWFFPGTDVFESNVAGVLAQLAQVRSMLLPEQIMLVTRLSGGTCINRLDLKFPDGPGGAPISLFSPAALDDATEAGRWILRRQRQSALDNPAMPDALREAILRMDMNAGAAAEEVD